jgi:hypothetical protein
MTRSKITLASLAPDALALGDLSAGEAAANIGTLGGVLSGTLPNPSALVEPFAVKSGAYTMVAADRVIIQTAAAAITLCAASAVAAGTRVEIKSTIAGASIVRGGANTIWSSAAGQTTLALGAGDAYSLRSDGSSIWYVVA